MVDKKTNPRLSHSSDLKMGSLPATSQNPGVIGSVLGLVCLVSVYCDCVRWQVSFASSMSVWQHVKFS